MVTVVVTIRNESGSIESLLRALEEQSHLPDAVIIVDADSSDDTVDRVQQFSAKTKLKIDIIESTGNRSKGRNIGISAADTRIIAITDAGCIPKKDWLEKLIYPFEDNKCIVVAGGYEMYSSSVTGKIMASFMGTPFSSTQLNFLPSSRSIAFTKKAWEQVGGYPEHLDYCEDLVFAEKLTKIGEMAFAPSAQVIWNVQGDFWIFFQKLRHYAQGDVVAGFRPHVFKILTIYLRWMILLVLPFLIPIYLVSAGFVKQRKHLSLSSLLTTVLVQLVADCAVIVGSLEGLWIRTVRAVNP